MRTLIPLLGATGVLLIASGLGTGTSRNGERAKVALRFPIRRIAASLGTFAVTGSVVLAGTQLASLALIAGSGAACIPFVLHASLLKRRARASRAQWPDVIQELVSIVRSGSSLPEAWMRLGERDFPGISEHLVAATATYRSSGSFVVCLDDARDRLRDPIAAHVLLAIKIAYEVGGTDLVPALRTLADSVAADLATRQEIESRWSWTVSSARVAAAAPWVVLLLLLSRPETVRAYATPGGAWVLLLAAVMSAAGYLLMWRAARLPEQGG